MPKVSVITVYYNRGPLVERSVQSLLKQSADDFEIVLVDDGSNDDTLAQMRRFEGGRVRVITAPNQGFTRALKGAIDACSSDYIAIHGSGDISYPERIALQAKALDEHSHVGVVGCDVEVLNESDLSLLRSVRVVAPEPAGRGLLKKNPFVHGSLMLRRTHYDQAGGYRPFFELAQDRDVLCRMSRICAFHRVPTPLYGRVHHLTGSVSATPSKVIRQMAYSALAVHCHRVALKGAPEPFDVHGPIAGAIMGRSVDFERSLLRRGASHFFRGQQKEAAMFFQSALDHAPSLPAWAGLTLSRLLKH